MRIFFVSALIFSLAFTSLKAQLLHYPLALPYMSLSAYSTQQSDVFSFTANQAALAHESVAAIGLYAEQRFLLTAINAYTLAATLPTKNGHFGVQLNYAGFKNFNDNQVGIAYAKNLGKQLDVGIQFNYYSYHIAGYGGASTINAEAGAIVHITDKLNFGIHVYNPVAAKLGKATDEKLASVYKIGLGYDASENFFISTQIIKEENRPINIVAGFQYQFEKQFFARAGFVSQSSSVFAAAGWSFKNYRIDAGGSYHPQLGFSPGVLLITNFSNKKAQ